jgi:hypothetical protein
MTDETTSTDSSTDTELTEVATGGDTVTVDLHDLLDDLEAEADELRDLKANAEERDDVQWPPEEYATTDRPILQVDHSADLVRADIERFGGSEFVIKKARAGETMRATDMVAGDSIKSDGDARSQVSSARKRMVQVCVEQVPPNTPTTADGQLAVTAFETPTFNWLHQKVDNFNTYGQADLEDF